MYDFYIAVSSLGAFLIVVIEFKKLNANTISTLTISVE